MKKSGDDLFMVFDVESVGLHGEGFAVGYVVINLDGKEFESGAFETAPEKALGTPYGLAWVKENVIPTSETGLACDYRDGLGSKTAREVRSRFWARWMAWREVGARLAADCLWPVEARFLIACVEDDREAREWQGPYPFLDVASVRFAASLDPLGTEPRLARELPIHNALADARQSARLLIEAMAVIHAAQDRRRAIAGTELGGILR